ncbi:phage tail assembly chaperone [Pseudomonas tohonis]|uniref:phage tail assembly chaperone n=1 Tax=Pseudomonas tohonis TaxID=2725477 RepID=UPI001F233D06|nr:phage tail assembly chaperone [Pseudomonas tohonis]
MAKFVLDPAPTFKAPVEIPVHGGNATPVVFEFKHRSRDEMLKLSDRANGGELNELDSVLEVAVGWELDDPFNAESIEKLLQNYQGAGHAVIRKYLEEIRQARLGN